MSLTTSRAETFPSTQSPTSFPTLVPQISLTTSLPPLSSSGETRTQPENITSPARDSGLNSTLLPISSTQGSGMGMVLLPVGIITVLALLLVVLLYIRKKKRLDKLRHQLMPMYSFDPAEEQDDLEQELLDHGRDGSPARPNSKTLTSSHGTTQKPSRLVFSDVAEAIRA